MRSPPDMGSVCRVELEPSRIAEPGTNNGRVQRQTSKVGSDLTTQWSKTRESEVTHAYVALRSPYTTLPTDFNGNRTQLRQGIDSRGLACQNEPIGGQYDSYARPARVLVRSLRLARAMLSYVKAALLHFILADSCPQRCTWSQATHITHTHSAALLALLVALLVALRPHT